MLQRKSKTILIYFFLLIVLGSINNTTLNEIRISKVKNISISGLDGIAKKKLLEDLNNLNLKNIFFLNSDEIKNLIESNSLVDKYKITKKYPYSIGIQIKKTSFLAQINLNGSTFVIGNNGKLSNERFSKIDLPYIFGKPEINEFLEIKKIIDESKIEYQKIKSLFYFQSKRWDIKLKNGILIKLPNNFKKENLDTILLFLADKNLDKIKIIDARIKNQIIINE